MPRNGSGTYSLPNTPVVNGTTIDPSDENTTRSDIATAITQSLASDGQTVPTANLPMGGFKHTGMAIGSSLTDSATFGQTINAPAATTLASAATVNIGAALTTNVTISGTTTITAFDTVADGIKRDVTYSGAVPITHNATSMILIGGASRTNAVGDCSTFVSLGSGNWRETKYQAATAATARAALGSTTVGDALFIASSASAGRTALGLGSIVTKSGDLVWTSQSAGLTDWIGHGYCVSTTQALVILPFPVSVSVKPTGVVFDGGGNWQVTNSNGSTIAASVTPTFYASSETAMALLVTVASGLVAGDGTFFSAGASGKSITATGYTL